MSLNTPASLARYRQRSQAFNRGASIARSGARLLETPSSLIRGPSPPPCDSCGGLRSVTSFTPPPPSSTSTHYRRTGRVFYLLSIAPAGRSRTGCAVNSATLGRQVPHRPIAHRYAAASLARRWCSLLSSSSRLQCHLRHRGQSVLTLSECGNRQTHGNK